MVLLVGTHFQRCPRACGCSHNALTAAQLATLLAVSRINIYKLAKKNRIPSFRIDSCVRFDPKPWRFGSEDSRAALTRQQPEYKNEATSLPIQQKRLTGTRFASDHCISLPSETGLHRLLRKNSLRNRNFYLSFRDYLIKNEVPRRTL